MCKCASEGVVAHHNTISFAPTDTFCSKQNIGSLSSKERAGGEVQNNKLTPHNEAPITRDGMQI